MEPAHLLLVFLAFKRLFSLPPSLIAIDNPSLILNALGFPGDGQSPECPLWLNAQTSRWNPEVDVTMSCRSHE